VTLDTLDLLCVLALCVVLSVAQGVGVTPPPRPVVEPEPASAGQWIQLYHGELDGTHRIIVPAEKEELYPGSAWTIFNVRAYFESQSFVTVRIAGVTHWVTTTEGPVSFHADATEQDGEWVVSAWASGPVFADLWAVLDN